MNKIAAFMLCYFVLQVLFQANDLQTHQVWILYDYTKINYWFSPQKSPESLTFKNPSQPIEIKMVISLIKSFSFSQIKVKNRHPQISMENQ